MGGHLGGLKNQYGEPGKKVNLLIEIAVVFIFTSGAYAQMGKSFEESPFKNKYTDVREYEEMGRKFKAGRLYDVPTGLMTTHTFMNGRLARVIFIRPDGEWSEVEAKRLWVALLGKEKIEEQKNLKDFAIYEGEDGGFMAIGRGESKNSLLFESSELNKLNKEFISRAVDTKIAEQTKNNDDGVRITFGGKKRNINSEDRSRFVTYNNGTSGRISSGGAIYDMYGQQKGWVNSSGFINYNDGTSGRISQGGAVYNMYGQQTGWARGNNNDD